MANANNESRPEHPPQPPPLVSESTAPPREWSSPPAGGDIYALLPRAASLIGAVTKDQTNTFDKYKFRGIDDLYNAVGPVFARVGITLSHRIDWERVAERESKQGTQMFHVVLQQTTRFSAPDGSHVETQTIGEAMDRGDKGYNKAMSAATKYALLRTLAIPTEDQVDADRESHDVRRTVPPGGKAKSQPRGKPAIAPPVSSDPMPDFDTALPEAPPIKGPTTEATRIATALRACKTPQQVSRVAIDEELKRRCNDCRDPDALSGAEASYLRAVQAWQTASFEPVLP